MDFNTLRLRLPERLNESTHLVDKTNKSSVLIIQQFPHDRDSEILLPRVRESISNIIAFVELGTIEALAYVIEKGDGVFDAIAMDADIKCSFSASLVSLVKNRVRESQLFFYSDNTTWADSAIHFIQNTERGLLGKNILVAGEGLLCNKLIQNLGDFGARVFWYRDTPTPELDAWPSRYNESVQFANDESDLSAIDIIVGASIKQESVSADVIRKCKNGINAFDIGIGNFSPGAITLLEDRNCMVYRLDNRAGISSTILGLFETDYLINKMMGRVMIKGVEMVSGGTMGHKGAIIVDSVKDPTYIIGIADGRGHVRLGPGDEVEEEDLKFVQKLITRP